MAPEEETFRAYTQDQGKAYAAIRLRYPPELFKIILDHHASTGGQLDTAVDVGCGTGQAICGFADHFTNAIGLDPSEGMISTARTLSAASTEPGVSSIRFEVSTAEALGTDLDPSIADGSIDLLTAATAAHWFDMARFWPCAARVLKPGGTVALWTRSRLSIHQQKTPNGAAIQAALEDMRNSEMRPYIRPGNEITRNLYNDLPLPWTLEDPVEAFEKESFFRKEWNTGGEFAETGGSFSAERTVAAEDLEKLLATSSPVTRWREANPDKVATEEDILRRLRRRVESLLHEVGIKPDEKVITGGVAMVLLMVKRKAE